jgi:hypothetical protein
MLGLDGAGKTTILHKLAKGQWIQTVNTIGEIDRIRDLTL